MQSRKHTAWKKNRKFGDIAGGRLRTKVTDNLFNRLHNLQKPSSLDALPVFIIENPSRDFYFPLTKGEIQAVLDTLPREHTQHITHIWLQKVKKTEYQKGETFQGCFVSGSGVNVLLLHPFPHDLKMRLGVQKPPQRVLNFYKHYSPLLHEDADGWYLQWTADDIKRYYAETLLLHEIGHAIDSLHKRFWSKAARAKAENYADNYAAVWAATVRESGVIINDELDR